MKLIFCPTCHDVRRLKPETVECECGDSWGEYKGDLFAEIYGKAIPIGFANRSFVYALQNRPLAGLGILFEAFVIPQSCPTVKQN
jgi:hypothetical protein